MGHNKSIPRGKFMIQVFLYQTRKISNKHLTYYLKKLEKKKAPSQDKEVNNKDQRETNKIETTK